MKIGKLTPEQLDRYQADRDGFDSELRRLFNVPEDRYYMVSLFPEKVAGEVWLDTRRTRIVKSVKISKSNQTP